MTTDPVEGKTRPRWLPTYRDLTWLLGGFASAMLVVFLAGVPTVPSRTAPEAAPTSAVAVSPPPSPVSEADPSPATVPMPDLIGKTLTAGTIAIKALNIFAQVDQEVIGSACTSTPTGSLPIIRTEPVAGFPLEVKGVRIKLYIDRNAGKPCEPTAPPVSTTAVAPPGNTYVNPPNVNLPNPNLPNLNPCKHTRFC